MKTSSKLETAEDVYVEIIQSTWFQELTAEEQFEVLNSGFIKFLTDYCNNAV